MFLSFEKSIEDKAKKLDELRVFAAERQLDLSGEIDRMQGEIDSELREIYTHLTVLQKVQVARHPNRPNCLEYVSLMVDDFVELHGDRLYRDDAAIVGGLGKIAGHPVMIIGSQKGRGIEDSIMRNFGMGHPEGYRKALRLMKLADRFNVPIISFIDTAGAYPGLGAEERGQGEAIARNLLEMFDISSPIIAVVIGEGGSGGALALGVGNQVLMLENSYYSVISPEGAASILFKDSSRVEEVAKCLQIDSESLRANGVVDEIIPEPIGGAHRRKEEMAENIKQVFVKYLEMYKSKSVQEIRDERYMKFRKMGNQFINGIK